MIAFLELAFDVVATFLIGAVPERQPWRAIVSAFYVLGAAAGVAVIVWTIVTLF